MRPNPNSTRCPPNSQPKRRSTTHDPVYRMFGPKDDKLIQQLLGAADLAMSDHDAVLGREDLLLDRRKRNQDSTRRDETLDSSKMR